MKAEADSTLAAIVGDLSANGDRTALVAGARSISHAELAEQADRLANALLALGLEPGQRFAYTFPNSIEIVLCHFACARGGIVGVPMPQRATATEIAFQLRDSGAVAVAYPEASAARVLEAAAEVSGVRLTIGPGGNTAESLDDLAKSGTPGAPPGIRHPNDVFSVIYTGGTTGDPKAAIQTQGGWAASVEATRDVWHLNERDRHLLALAMTHVAWFTCPAYLSAGASCYLLERWDPEHVLEVIERDRITHVNMIPTMLGDLLLAREGRPDLDLSSLRMLTVAGSPTPEEIVNRAHDLFGPVYGNIYGMTESAGGVTFLVPADAVGNRVRSGGRPGRALRIRIVDEHEQPLPPGEAGEVALSGPQMSPGYVRAPAGERPAHRGGWFYTGDIGYLDEDGFLFIVDRLKDVIISGGYNVYPKEVEEALYEHQDVLEAAVIGLPDDRWIEAVHACVVVRFGSTLTADDLRQHCRQSLSPYKVPKDVHFEQELPRTVVGKFDKRALRRRLAGD